MPAAELDALEDHLNSDNRRLTGHDDDRSLVFELRDDMGRAIGIAAGYSWAGIAELKLMWVDETCRGLGYAGPWLCGALAMRGLGYGTELLNAFVAEATNRRVLRIWVSTHDFQAPTLYEKAGFERIAEVAGWPEGHSNIILCKTIVGDCAVFDRHLAHEGERD